MELFRRVEMVLSLEKMPDYILAEKLNVQQSTPSRCFCREQKGKLKVLLWDIAALFPEINRQRLFFEEGKILQNDEDAARNDEKKRLEDEAAKLKDRLAMTSATSGQSCACMGRAGRV